MASALQLDDVESASAARPRQSAAATSSAREHASDDDADADADRPQGHDTSVVSIPEGAGHILRTEGRALFWFLARSALVVGIISVHVTAILAVLTKDKLAEYSVDKQTCGGCDCWDGLSKAPYDKGRFKFVYFNMQPETLGLLALVMTFGILLERSVSALGTVVFSGRADWTAVAAFALAVPGVLYGAGATFHYINDEFHMMVPTQTFFTVTETVTAACILRVARLEDRLGKTKAQARSSQSARAVCLWLVWSIALSHVILAGLDQAFMDLFVRSQEISAPALARAAVFMSTDSLLLVWASWQLGLLSLCFRGRLAWPGWTTIGGWAAGSLVVVAWYRLFLPLV